MIITNGKIITWDQFNRILEGYALLIGNGKIISIAPQAQLIQNYPAETCMDAHGQYVMPGNICAHTHFYGAFARGMAIPGEAPKDFPEILEKLWWRLDRSLTLDAVRYSALVCQIDAIRHGTTLLVDHHASPTAIENSLDVIAETVTQSGLRASLCYEVTDRDGAEKAKAGIEENMRFIQRIKKDPVAEARIGAMFGLHASLTLSDATLESVRSVIPDGIGFHIHAAEHEVDEYDSLEKSGMRVIDRLDHFGILGPKTMVGHAVHVDADEIQLLADTKTWVSHQPRSNMNNGVGLPQVEAMLQCGVNVCLGNDGFSNDMWTEWKFAYLGHKLLHRDPRRMNGNAIIQMAVHNNSAFATQQFGFPIGVIKEGAAADLIFVDYKPITPLTEGNLPWHILFGFHESMVTGTMVNGEVLMWNRQLKTLDEEEITIKARELVPTIWRQFEEYF